MSHTKEAAIELAIDGCIEDDVMAGLLKKERARVRNILISGLTEEEKEQLYEMQRKRDVEEARTEAFQSAKYEDVNRLVSDGLYDVERACEVLGVQYEEYLKYSSN